MKVILDGEEEARSPSLAATMGRYRDKYRADLMLILDGPLHSSGKPTLSFGARGNLVFQLTTFGPKFALHSGHYGNWAPNPALDLVQLLASMKDANGRVIVNGFYDDVPPLSPEERQILAAVPDRRDELMRFFGISRTEQVGDNLQEALQYPSLNIRGLQSGDIGDQARTIIPDRAIAEIDVRLVKETDPERMLQRVVTHIRAQGFHVLLNVDPDDEMRARYPRIVRISRVELDEGVQDRDDAAGIAGAHQHARARVGRAAGPHPHDGRHRADRLLHSGAWHAGDLCSGREFRQQPAQQQREPPSTEPVGCVGSLRRSADVTPAGRLANR